ncbi:succinic semialdehyde dehydrogenase [Nocardia sp. alder85J]|uniref:succinic semialdehyde dehydrogenase n=1 Tax=Nocardia sp. alder85J TaxID=2862949 RepID=UPI001CD40A64|nr:succinic semialdehyde dehydrogenase [Nocardia sp. alder85J]MCX4094206.1 succinic semialdehyde dehydrogenase [Nocardia sp. alder85J]
MTTTTAAATPPDSITPGLLDRLRSHLPPSDEPRSATAPFTGASLPPLPRTTTTGLAGTVAAARAAQPDWAATPVRDRERIVLRFAAQLLEHQDLLCDLMQWETGKARVHAAVEAQGVVSVARYYGRRAHEHLAERRARSVLPGVVTTRVGYRPKGVVGVIAPWNYPLFLAVGDVIPALLAGNAVLSKADSQAPWTLLAARELATRAGLPQDVWRIVAGPGATIGPALIEAVDYLCFTGSTATGRDIARRCADRLIGASLELGGKNAMIVCADADLSAAARGAVQACFASAGQMCIGIERIYVHDKVFDRFVTELAARTARMRLGAGYGWDVDMGSLTTAAQWETTVAHIRDAVDQGARVVAGGHARPDLGPYFHEPTVLTGVTPAMRVCAEETFGPVVSVYPVTSEDAAIAAANTGEYGLSASVWTRDTVRGTDIARRIVAGAVNVNDGYLSAIASVDAPMGGMRTSGLGRRHGREGILRYTEPQTVATQRFPTPTPDRLRDTFFDTYTRAQRLLAARWPRP